MNSIDKIYKLIEENKKKEIEENEKNKKAKNKRIKEDLEDCSEIIKKAILENNFVLYKNKIFIENTRCNFSIDEYSFKENDLRNLLVSKKIIPYGSNIFIKKEELHPNNTWDIPKVDVTITIPDKSYSGKISF